MLQRLRSKILVFKNWHVLKYHSVYEILKVEDVWTISVALVVNDPTGDARTDQVLFLPLQIGFYDPQLAFLYLQMLGPLFQQTASKVVVMEYGKPVIQWDLTKPPKEQSITKTYADVLQPQSQPQQSNSEIQTTHQGSVAIN